MILDCIRSDKKGNKRDCKEGKTSFSSVIKEGLVEKITIKWRPTGWGASLVAQMVKNLPAMQEIKVQSLGRKDPLGEERTLVFLPGESHGPRSLAGYSPWGRKESDKTERLAFSLHFHYRMRWFSHVKDQEGVFHEEEIPNKKTLRWERERHMWNIWSKEMSLAWSEWGKA